MSAGTHNGAGSPRTMDADSILVNTMMDRIEHLINNESMFRRDMLSRMMDPRRNIEDECGYPALGDPISIELYRDLYDRGAIPARVVEVLPKESWQSQPTVYEDEDADVITEFEEAWDDLGHNLRGPSWYNQEEGSPVWEHLLRADILSGIGHFGVLLLGIGDNRRLDLPIEGVLAEDAAGNGQQESLLHPEEEKQLKEMAEPGQTREVPDLLTGKPKKVPITPLNNEEKLVINGWVKQREVAVDLVKKGVPVANAVSEASKLLGFSPGDTLLSSSGWSPLGTDQQYFGVQFGPLETLAPQPSTSRKPLIFLRSFDESLVQIVRYEWNIRSPRFGMPTMYRVTLNDPKEMHSGIGLPLATVFVHWTRVIHIADNLRSSEIFGVPRMRAVLDNLLGLRKMYGASPEGYWKSCFNILSAETHPQLGGDVKINEERLKDRFEKLTNSLERTFLGKGMSLKAVAPSVVDPTTHIDKQLEAICILLGIPLRIFKGSERGELASSQDDSSWNDRLLGRQLYYITPRIIVPFIDRLIQAGVLPVPSVPQEAPDKSLGSKAVKDASAKAAEAAGGAAKGGPEGSKPPSSTGQNDEPGMGGGFQPMTSNTNARRGRSRLSIVFNEEDGTATVKAAGYRIDWPALDSLTDKERAEVFKTRMDAYGVYIEKQIESIIPPHDVMTKFDKMDEDEAEAVLTAAEENAEATMTMPAAGLDGNPTSEALPDYPIDPETGEPVFPEIPEGAEVHIGDGGGGMGFGGAGPGGEGGPDEGGPTEPKTAKKPIGNMLEDLLNVNSDFGKGWWFNTKTKKLVEMDPGSLGPHGDHDGWITIGDHAMKLGVDKHKATAFQMAQYGVASDSPHWEQFKHLDTDGYGYVDPFGEHSEEFDKTFRKVTGFSTDDVLKYPAKEFGHLWRARLWPGGNLSITSGGVDRLNSRDFSIASKILEHNNIPLSDVTGITFGNNAETIHLPRKEFLEAENLRDLRGTKSGSGSGANCGTGAGGFKPGNKCSVNNVADLEDLLNANYNPAQPRVPAGSSAGGQWAGGGSTGGSSRSDSAHESIFSGTAEEHRMFGGRSSGHESADESIFAERSNEHALFGGKSSTHEAADESIFAGTVEEAAMFGGSVKKKSPIGNEPTTRPNAPVFKPDVHADHNGDGVTDAARVGVPAHSMPPPPKVPRLPNLTEHERKVETEFAEAYEKDPAGMAAKFRAEVVAKGGVPTFGTDDAKELHAAWRGDGMSLDERSQNRAQLNTAMHQTANAVAKRALLQHLDTLQPGDEIMVTVGGCGCGKGYGLGVDDDTKQPRVPEAHALKQRSKAVWDSAGDQNASENTWVQQEAEKRGLKVNYVWTHADPYKQWADPTMGVVQRAKNPKDGRMVDAKVFADSYAIGNQNHQAFYENNKNNPNANFVFLTGRGKNGKPERIDGIPPEALNIDRHHLASYASEVVTFGDAPAHIKRGATIGQRIWPDDEGWGE